MPSSAVPTDQSPDAPSEDDQIATNSEALASARLSAESSSGVDIDTKDDNTFSLMHAGQRSSLERLEEDPDNLADWGSSPPLEPEGLECLSNVNVTAASQEVEPTPEQHSESETLLPDQPGWREEKTILPVGTEAGLRTDALLSGTPPLLEVGDEVSHVETGMQDDSLASESRVSFGRDPPGAVDGLVTTGNTENDTLNSLEQTSGAVLSNQREERNEKATERAGGTATSKTPKGPKKHSDLKPLAATTSRNVEPSQPRRSTAPSRRTSSKKVKGEDGKRAYVGGKLIDVDTAPNSTEPDTLLCAVSDETGCEPGVGREDAARSARWRRKDTDESIPTTEQETVVEPRRRKERALVSNKQRDDTSGRQTTHDTKMLRHGKASRSKDLGFFQVLWAGRSSRSARVIGRHDKSPTSNTRSAPKRGSRADSSKQNGRRRHEEEDTELPRAKRDLTKRVVDQSSRMLSTQPEQSQGGHEPRLQSTAESRTQKTTPTRKKGKGHTVTHAELMGELGASHDTTHGKRKNREVTNRDRSGRKRDVDRHDRYLSDPTETRNSSTRKDTGSTPGTFSRLLHRFLGHEPVKSAAMTRPARHPKHSRRALQVDPDSAWKAEVSKRGKEFGVTKNTQAEPPDETVHSMVGETPKTTEPEKRTRRDRSGTDHAFEKGTSKGKHRERKRGGRGV